jgi:pimeloyl-ACP methyl ester carboxylesterase
MQTVTSADGTAIVYERHGDGRPLILVHGGSADRHHWNPLRDHLADEFTVYAVDRRGRNDSGDGDDYSLRREVEDLQAVVETARDESGTGADPLVFGHSFGGLVALAAAPDLELAGLVVYEPALLVGEHRDDDLAARMEAKLDDGDRRGAFRLFLEEAGGVPDADVLPWWPDEAPLDRVETVVRENREVEAFELSEEPAVDAPALLLTGERGPPQLRDGVRALDERLSDGRVVEFDGLGHMATSNAPELVAETVREFAVETPPEA